MAAETRRTAAVGFLPPFLGGALLLFTLGISLPVTLYLNNVGEFSITLTDLLSVAIPALLLALGLSSLLIWRVRLLQRARVAAILVALALLVWFQGHILVWQYGALDGRSIDWDAHRINGVIDGLLWVSVLLGAAWKPRAVWQSARIVVPVIIALQLAVLAGTGLTAGERTAGSLKEYRIDKASKFALSRDRNAILIVLDEAQSSVFEEIVGADESYRRIFDGFTYFPDAIGSANYTELAIPAMLTGQLYDNSVPRDQYLREAFLEHSIPAVLKRNGFHVEIFPWVGWANESIYFDASVAHNLKSAEGSGSDESVWSLTEKGAKEIIHLADLALFRTAPHVLKRHVYDNQRWLLMGVVTKMAPDEVKQITSSDNEFETLVFAEQAASQLRLAREGDAFFYYHLKGAHQPLTVTPDLKVGREPVEFTRENYVRQYQASLRGLELFFAELKALGVYDRSLVVVVGDHGSGEVEELYVGSVRGARPVSKIEPGPNRRNFPKDKARAIPLVLVKRPGAAGPLQKSDTPVWLLDLPATILSELGVHSRETGGRSMFDSAADQSVRVRRYGAFNFSENRTSYVGPISLYEVAGDARKDTSWTLVDILVPPSAGRLNASR